jgi:hypothetical protein
LEVGRFCPQAQEFQDIKASGTFEIGGNTEDKILGEIYGWKDW